MSPLLLFVYILAAGSGILTVLFFGFLVYLAVCFLYSLAFGGSE